MDEKYMNTVIESLAETIERLRLEVCVLKYENKRLNEQIKKEGTNNA